MGCYFGVGTLNKLIWLHILLLATPVWAGGTDVDVKTITDVSAVGGAGGAVHNSSDSFGYSLGDVDINDCYRSYSLVVWQDSKINWWCVARDYDAMGLHDAAAKVRCNKLKGIRQLFDTERECLTANTVVPRQQEDTVFTEQKLSEIEEQRRQDDEEFHVEHQQRYEDLYTKLRNLEEVVSQPQRVVERTVEQRGLTDKQKAALREAIQ